MNGYLVAACVAVAGFAAGWIVRDLYAWPVVSRFKSTTYGAWAVERECVACHHAVDFPNGLCPNCGGTEYSRPKIGRRVNTTEPGKPFVETWEWKP